MNLGEPTHMIIWIGEGADVPFWLEDLLPLAIQTFSAHWSAQRQEVGSILGYWSNGSDKFIVVAPRSRWTIEQHSLGGVIYWGHGPHNLSELVAGNSVGIDWVSQLSGTRQIDGSSPCSIVRIG
ncbi:MAG: hypothetical protein CFE32_12795 [Alphaproteobacteria bacterium PA3]|nr:MAG: hypothetical protein CFE32_12795 [Alphaproteobacteria bacterium PA3]